ncbi:hypothetical protein [Neobacillus drentensis]|uniref:hypothetical protein n=1 Tax=Neobacillus drentensis TaxID=220684 RepID=UPI00300099BF
MSGGNGLINQNTSNSTFPIINPGLSSDVDSKLNEDRYDVYVNDNFVGHKALKTQGEELSDIDDFLRNQGFNSFSTSLDGDHYTIQANEQMDDIANALSIYFQNR